MPILESLLCGLTTFIYIESIRDCFQRHRERQNRSEERVPILIQSIISRQSFDIQQFAPITEVSVEEEDTCPICFDKLSTIRYRRKTICGHTFCSECLQEWLHKKKSCPICVRPFTV